MKRFLAALLLLLVPANALAQIKVKEQVMDGEGENRVVIYAVEEHEGEEPDEAALKAAMLLEERFMQQKSVKILERSGVQGGSFLIGQFMQMPPYQDEKIFSAGRLWYGEQPDGVDGCSAAALTIDLETGEEIPFESLFQNTDAAVAEMEAIIERDILPNISDYMEFAELLPMPTDVFSVNETGLTVYYQDDAYRNFDGVSGSVTFYWYELAEFIGQDSPVYSLANQEEEQDVKKAPGYFGGHEALGLHKLLGDAGEEYPLAEDPDYTRTTKVYTIERPDLRGYAVEIGRYADTDDEKTPICAVRHSRISWNGLTTGRTTRQEIIDKLGEPNEIRTYTEEQAADELFVPGDSLLYQLQEYTLELHLDEAGILSCVRLGDVENLY